MQSFKLWNNVSCIVQTFYFCIFCLHCASVFFVWYVLFVVEFLKWLMCHKCRWVFAQGIGCTKVYARIFLFKMSNVNDVPPKKWSNIGMFFDVFITACFKSQSRKKHNGCTLLLHKPKKILHKRKNLCPSKFKWYNGSKWNNKFLTGVKNWDFTSVQYIRIDMDRFCSVHLAICV